MNATQAEPLTNTGLAYRSGGYRNYVIISLMLLYTLNFIDRILIGVVAQPIIEEFRLQDWQFGLLSGFGFALMEENPIVDGKIATLTLGESKLPCITDVPPLKTVLVESPTGPTPFGGKAIAENPNVPTAAAIANAVADACGVRIFDLPITAEKVYQALQRKPD